MNPIDTAIREYKKFDISGYQKLDQVPYDFNRKRQSIVNSKPGKYLFAATLLTVGVTIIIPWTHAAILLKFQPLPLSFVLVVGVIVVLYVIAAENVKRVFYSRVKF